MSIAAEVQRIRDVFSVGTDIRVPPFQRAYAWEDEETEALIKDLLFGPEPSTSSAQSS